MLTNQQNEYSINKSILLNALVDSFKQLNPIEMFSNPIMFVVEICFFIMIFLTFNPSILGESVLTKEQNFIITLLLFLTLLFANFAENLAKIIGKTQAESLRLVHGDIEVKKIDETGAINYIFASQLKKGDTIKVQEGDLIPLDGEIIGGIASVDESAITGESSLVLKEAGTDTTSTVTGGTRIITDWLLIKITSEHGETYLDQMVYVAEGTERHKTPNELSLSALLTGSTLSCLLAVVVLGIVMNYMSLKVEYPFFITLLVCLIPTTIGGLLVPITISGFEKINTINVLAVSKNSIENAGDINYVFLDKTGTITHGNRMAIEFIPIGNYSLDEVAKISFLSTYFDQTPEGKSILTLAKRHGSTVLTNEIKGIPHEFSAHTRMSGIDMENGDILRKGAPDAIESFIKKNGGVVDDNTKNLVNNIAIQGGTPLLVSKNNEIVGIVNLKDLIKTSAKGKYKELKDLGVKVVMCTGDNELTAKVIAQEAGIEEYIAQAKPEDKIQLIRDYQSKGLNIAMIGDGTNDAPALAQADIGLAMNNGTTASKEAANMIDLDSDPTKIIDIIKIGRQLLITRGSLTTFSIINDIAKYFLILPSILPIAGIEKLNILNLETGFPAVLSALIFNTIIIPIMTPIAIKGVEFSDESPNKLLEKNLLFFGLGGILLPFIIIKLTNLVVGGFY